MTDKQIIIDGINVAGCIRLQDDEISCNLGGECKGWENCYYKQLKHKEQKCEELKSDLTDLSKIIDCKNGTILTFKQQLDQLKADNEKLKQTLTEIKEICNEYQKEYILNIGVEILTNKILQII